MKKQFDISYFIGDTILINTVAVRAGNRKFAYKRFYKKHPKDILILCVNRREYWDD